MRKAKLLIENQITGWLIQDENGYLFEYEKSYLSKTNARLVSLTLPIREILFQSTISILETVQIEGKREVKRNIEYYCPNAIISVGYLVNSHQATTRIRV